MKIATVFVAGVFVVWSPAAWAGQVSEVAKAIRIEATRPDDGPEGRPLPLATHWSTGSYPAAKGRGPAWQLRMIEQGHHLLPWFQDPADNRIPFAEYYEAPLKRARQLNLPFVIVNTQWESRLSREPYLGLPPEKNPNVVTAEGKVLAKVSPFGPVAPWREVGASWTNTAAMKQLQQLYPDPPLVIFLSNNEHGKLVWTKVEQSKRYLDRYGEEKDPEFKRKVVADGWIERYRALQEGLRDGLVSKSWKDRAIFVGYEAFGPAHFGRWGGWGAYALNTAGRIAPDPLMWDGGSPSYYTPPYCPTNDYTVYSPQIESMNWVFMLDQARKLNPKFWFELSIWDGKDAGAANPNLPWKPDVYRSLGQTYDPARYGGYVQFGMWLLRPRTVREFRSHIFPHEEGKPYFMAIVEAVDRVYANTTLKEFWRKGKLVPNRAHQHPYQAAIPPEYAGVDRWFLLDADVNPRAVVWQSAEHSGGSQQIPVFSLALVRGQSPSRRWLLYAYSPLKDRQRVKITIPDYRAVTVDVSVAGSFYLVDEKDETVTPVSSSDGNGSGKQCGLSRSNNPLAFP